MFFSIFCTFSKCRIYRNFNIYINEYIQTSFLKINGVLTKFTQTDLNKLDHKTVFLKAKSTNFNLTIEVKDEIKNGDEKWLKSGEIILTNKNGQNY